VSSRILLVFSVLTSVLSPFAAAQGAPSTIPGRIVMTWVPPYGIEKCRTRLDTMIAGFGPQNALTHLALQFWLPTSDGGVEKTPKYGPIADATITQFRDWAHAHGIRALLCVYNHNDTWDWALAQAAFGEHREVFINALVTEMQRLQLDGIDLDLEGNGAFEDARTPYISFVHDLSARLRPLGKQLTVDSFAYVWNAPNQGWWPELFPLVDAVNSMGYEHIGVNAAEWRSYAAQKLAAGANARRLLIGIPSSKADWQDSTAAEHLAWLAEDHDVGVSIWDAQFRDEFWNSAEAWKTLAGIRAGR
jgi:hypothetical protein